MTIGVYIITCNITNKRYVGESVNIESRWSKHKHHLRNGTHRVARLQSDWDSYSESEFTFSIEEVCAVDVLKVRGQHYMDLYDCCNPNKGYNKEPLSTSSKGVKRKPLTSEHKKKCGESIKLKWQTDREAFMKNRKSPSEEFREAHSIRHKKLWTDPEYRARQRDKKVRAATTPEGREQLLRANEKAVKARSKTFVVTSPAGNSWLATNLAKFCREFDLKRASLGDVIKGRAPSCYGWVAREATPDDIASWQGEKFT